MRHIPEFDGLRGILSALVVIAHLQSSWMFWVWGSMDVFFAMSGFLIGSLLLRNQKKPGFFRDYAMRRILRIWPSYYAMLLFAVAGLFVVRQFGVGWPEWSPGLGTVQYLFFVQNVEMWFSSSGLSLANRGYSNLLGHCWSVALEEQFYVVVPFVCLMLSRGRFMRLRFALLFILAAAGGIALRTGYDANWATLPGRFDGFAAGLFLASIVHHDKGQMTNTTLRCCWAAIASGLGVLIYLYSQHEGRDYVGVTRPVFAWGVTVFSVVGAGALGLIYAHSGHRVLRLLRHRLPVLLGEMSYSTYLWHIPVIWFSTPVLIKLLSLSSLQQFWLQLTLCYLTAYIAHRLIERPLLRYRQYYTPPPSGIPHVAANRL